MRKSNYILIVIYTIVIMLFCLGSSPMIDFLSTDSAVFFTMGRSMSKGMVAYRDIFDHKGWYLYFFNMLGAMISSSGTIGLFIIETMFSLVNVFICFRIGKEYLDERHAILFSFLGQAVFLNYFTFQGGNLTESYSITFILISMYLLVLSDKRDKVGHELCFMMIHGMCAGVSFFLRPNLVMIYGAIPITIGAFLIKRKEYGLLIRNLLAGLLGVFLSFLPPVMYALLTGSTSDMFFQLITFNMSYSGDISLIEKIKSSFGNMTGLSMLILSGVSLVIVLKKYSVFLKILYIQALCMSVLTISFSGRSYGHYFEYMTPLLIPLIMFVASGISMHKHFRIIICALAVFTIVLNMRTPIRFLAKGNSFYLRQTAGTMSAEIDHDSVNNGKLHRLIVLGANNAIFYNVLNVYPGCRYYYIPAVPYDVFPDAVDMQYKAFMYGDTEYAVTHLAADSHWIYGIEAYDDAIYNKLTEKYVMLSQINGFQLWKIKDFGE